MDQYAVIGNPIAHSKSPWIHHEFAKQTKEALHYDRIEAPLDAFADTVRTFVAAGGKGANVTLPFKTQAFVLADEHSDIAGVVKAANTLLFREDGSIYADSTDGTGLIQDLTHNHHYSLLQKNILLLGAGGAAQSVVAPLLEAAPARLVIANRTKAKAQALAECYQQQGSVDALGLDELPNTPFDLIINATSTSLTEQALTVPTGLIEDFTYCYDMMYADELTTFLRFAKAQGAREVMDGLGMLVEQAAASFYLWRGVYPDTQAVIEKLRPTPISK